MSRFRKQTTKRIRRKVIMSKTKVLWEESEDSKDGHWTWNKCHFLLLFVFVKETSDHERGQRQRDSKKQSVTCLPVSVLFPCFPLVSSSLPLSPIQSLHTMSTSAGFFLSHDDHVYYSSCLCVWCKIIHCKSWQTLFSHTKSISLYFLSFFFFSHSILHVVSWAR